MPPYHVGMWIFLPHTNRWCLSYFGLWAGTGHGTCLQRVVREVISDMALLYVLRGWGGCPVCQGEEAWTDLLRMRQYKELVSNPSWANQESQSCADSTRTQQKTLPVGSSKTANREAAVESQWVLRWIVLEQEPNIMDLSWWLKLHHFIMRKVKANLLKINISGNFVN